MELVDTPDLKSCVLLGVRVQVPPRVQEGKHLCFPFFVSNNLQKEHISVRVHADSYRHPPGKLGRISSMLHF